MTFLLTLILIKVFCLISITSQPLSGVDLENLQGSGSGCKPGSDDEDCIGTDAGSGDENATLVEFASSVSPTTEKVGLQSDSTAKMPSTRSTNLHPKIIPTTTLFVTHSQLDGCSRRSEIDVRADLKYIPVCHAKQPHLFLPKQCTVSGLDCFCVNTESGQLIEQTRTSNVNLLCDSEFFNLTLAFAMTWHRELLHNTTTQFAELAKKVELTVEGLYSDAETFPGRQSAKVLFFRSGSVVAHILLTSVGHTSKRAMLHRILKAPLDAVVSQTIFKPFGYQLLPTKYRFTSAAESQEIVPAPKKVTPDKTKIRAATTVSSYNNIGAVQKDDSGQKNQRAESGALDPILLVVVIVSGVTFIIILGFVVLHCVHRARKADERRYMLDDAHSKKAQMVNGNVYHRAPAQEFYA